MKDAWLIWLTIKSLRKDNLKDLDGIEEILNDLGLGLRLVLDRPIAQGSAGDLIMKRLYKSWGQKSMWADDCNKKIEKGELDIYGAYAQAVFQTMLVTGPYDDSKKEEFYNKRYKEIEEVRERIKEWDDIYENQENEEKTTLKN